MLTAVNSPRFNRILTTLSFIQAIGFLYNHNHATASIGEFGNMLALRSYRPTRCRGHALDLRSMRGHGSSHCMSLTCRISVPGCLFSASCIIGLVQNVLVVCQQMARFGLSAKRRGTLRHLCEVLACPGYSKSSLADMLQFNLSILDTCVLLRATNDDLRKTCSDQMQVFSHPTLPAPGSSARILFPPGVKNPESPVSVMTISFITLTNNHQLTVSV